MPVVASAAASLRLSLRPTFRGWRNPRPHALRSATNALLEKVEMKDLVDDDDKKGDRRPLTKLDDVYARSPNFISPAQAKDVLIDVLTDLAPSASEAQGTMSVVTNYIDTLAKDARQGIHVGELWNAATTWLRNDGAEPRALIIVDVQNDFISGSLGLKDCPAGEDGAEVVPVINKLRHAGFDLTVTTQDWHPQNHISFFENKDKLPAADKSNIKDANLFDVVELDDGLKQTLWPTHCLQHSHGAALHSDLTTLPSDIMLKKGSDPGVDSYSAFYDNAHVSSTGLTDLLNKFGIKQVYVCGLAFDVCVAATAKDAADEGFKTTVIRDACRGVSPEGIDKAIKEFEEHSVSVIDSSALLWTL